MPSLPSNVKDITGQKFNRWTVLSYAGKSYWHCRCDCGTLRDVFTGNLKWKSRSCGCHRDERNSICNRTHGLSKSAEYKVWSGIKRRCLNANDKSFRDYGGAGVTICQRWADSFEAFLADMGKRPTGKHEIDRIDNGKGYEPGNCRWATRVQQARNKTTNNRISLNGETKTLGEWSAQLGVPHETIRYRIRAGWTIEQALTTPAVLGRNQTYVR